MKLAQVKEKLAQVGLEVVEDDLLMVQRKNPADSNSRTSNTSNKDNSDLTCDRINMTSNKAHSKGYKRGVC
ncbi:hypothetical protein MWH25_10430 [Natroniella acetigena]|uniref:hypothetical protein n=1 Tax=Natroniella acetigena TaxID=52004 RepID=UPI00200B323C|nr:hypothetical protein [Natroniella acetigena]MCK8828147.1 hypothetical protein [Natroniella acetigena]